MDALCVTLPYCSLLQRLLTIAWSIAVDSYCYGKVCVIYSVTRTFYSYIDMYTYTQRGREVSVMYFDETVL